jgi:hypothetical protein
MLIYSMSVSVDGFIADRAGSFGWTVPNEEQFLAAKKAAGVRLGRPRQLPTEVVERIVRSKAAGGSLAGIAREFTAEGVATAQGGKRRYASTVAAVLRSAEHDS